MTRDRQERQQEETRNKILAAARKIISQEGVRGLSIRKITGQLDYSPSLVYHYFKNKGDIVENLYRDGFGRIMQAIQAIEPDPEHPELAIRATFRQYFELVLAAPEEYKIFMLSEEPALLSRTALLYQGAAKKSPSIGRLAEMIEQGMATGRFQKADPELIAQILWSSAFGLVIRLTLEKDMPQEQIERLFNQQFDLIFNGLLNTCQLDQGGKS